MFWLQSGGSPRPAGAATIDENYVAASRRLLVQCEKNIGQFEIALLLVIGDGEGQVRRISRNRRRDRFRFGRLARFSGTGWHGIGTRETHIQILQSIGKGFDTLHRVNAWGGTGIDFLVSAGSVDQNLKQGLPEKRPAAEKLFCQ